eukprot:2978705-Alexandrium_andersonii.AAC.1
MDGVGHLWPPNSPTYPITHACAPALACKRALLPPAPPSPTRVSPVKRYLIYGVSSPGSPAGSRFALRR